VHIAIPEKALPRSLVQTMIPVPVPWILNVSNL